jgi:uncharacterized protein YdeI (YjbR/CyaY-like superfamily)
MGTRINAVDQYILKSQAFAQPILNHLREVVHTVCPDVEEKIKWGMPFFDYKNDLLCHMAAFKQHAVFSFWKASLMKDPILMENARSEQAMGHLGRITTLKDLPSDRQLKSWIKEAMELNDKGIKVTKPKAGEKKTTFEIPEILMKALKKNKAAMDVWKKATPGYQKEYANWIADAKTEATQLKRTSTAIEWIAEGKIRNWKYQ